MRLNNLDSAIALACKVHAGQTDKGGQPYILHPLRIMLKFNQEQEQIISVLHDVVEDGNVTIDDLRRRAFPDIVVDAIDCLSKRSGEDYQDFIIRISLNEAARKIKIEDIKDNLDLTRLKIFEESDFARIVKYHKALLYLEKIEAEIL